MEGKAALGPLEARVLEALWTRERAATVRDLQSSFPDLAYTTLMTTLDRLHRKGLLERSRTGRAFAYLPRWSRDVWNMRLAKSRLATLLPETASSIGPIMSMFVDAVSRRDAALLDELEALVRHARVRLPKDPP